MNAAQGPGLDPSPTDPMQKPPAPPEGNGGSRACDLAEIEHMACTAKKFARQAEVMTEVGQDLETFRSQYDEARGKYADARAAAQADLEAVRAVLEELAEQLRCRLKDDQRDCLEKAVEEVFEEIDECSEPRGCQSPCDDSDSGGLETSEDIDALAAEIERRRRNLTDSAAYFTSLVAEPDRLTEQAAALRNEANQLANDVAAGGDADKAVRWYARWLILDKAASMDRLGRGFASTTAYVECLCVVLRCIVSGWTVVAVLEGRKAELECYAEAQQKACDQLKADVLQAVLDAYEECYAEVAGGTHEGADTGEHGEEGEKGGGAGAPAQSAR